MLHEVDLVDLAGGDGFARLRDRPGVLAACARWRSQAPRRKAADAAEAAHATARMRQAARGRSHGFRSGRASACGAAARTVRSRGRHRRSARRPRLGRDRRTRHRADAPRGARRRPRSRGDLEHASLMALTTGRDWVRRGGGWKLTMTRQGADTGSSVMSSNSPGYRLRSAVRRSGSVRSSRATSATSLAIGLQLAWPVGTARARRWPRSHRPARRCGWSRRAGASAHGRCTGPRWFQRPGRPGPAPRAADHYAGPCSMNAPTSRSDWTASSLPG